MGKGGEGVRTSAMSTCSCALPMRGDSILLSSCGLMGGRSQFPKCSTGGALRPCVSRRVDRALSGAHREPRDQSFPRAARVRRDAWQAARRAMVGGGVRVRLRGRRGPGGVEPGGVEALGIGRLLGLRVGRLVCAMCVLGALSKRAILPRHGYGSARRASHRWRGTSPRPRARWWSRRWS